MAALIAFVLGPIGRWLAVGAGVLALVGFVWADHAYWKHQAEAMAQKAASERASATVAQNQTQAQQAAGAIVDQAHTKADVTVHIQQENAREILDSPGASAALDPALNAAGRRSLCNFAVYLADPGCAGLPGAGPGQPSGAGSSGPTPAG
jgi:Flp pilus assembly protein TadG